MSAPACMLNFDKKIAVKSKVIATVCLSEFHDAFGLHSISGENMFVQSSGSGWVTFIR